MAPALADASIRADIARFARGIERTELLDAADWLGRFDKPTRLVWGTADRHFKLALGRRLLATFPRAELDEVDGATTFVSVDRPDAVTAAVLQVAREAGTLTPTPTPTPTPG
jgi:pimeloyl-ACP methyl ester carboxylesterase